MSQRRNPWTDKSALTAIVFAFVAGLLTSLSVRRSGEESPAGTAKTRRVPPLKLCEGCRAPRDSRLHDLPGCHPFHCAAAAGIDGDLLLRRTGDLAAPTGLPVGCVINCTILVPWCHSPGPDWCGSVGEYDAGPCSSLLIY